MKNTDVHQSKLKQLQNQQQPSKSDTINFSQFFRYLNRRDKFLLIVGTISAICCGVLLPSISIMMGEITNTFDPRKSNDQVLDEMSRISGYIAIVGFAEWILGYIYYAFWQHMAENVSFNLRRRYLNAILKQEIAYFEKVNVEQLPTQIAENFFIITESIGEKFSNIIFSFSALLSGIGIAFYRGADFAAICLAFFPIIFAFMFAFGGQVKKSTIAKVNIVKQLGGVIEESLSAIKLIVSFANEEKEIKKFEKLADQTRNVAHSQEFWLSFFMGFFKLFIFGFYVYSFYIATIYMEKKKENPSNHFKVYNTGELLSVFVALMTGMMMVFSVLPQFEALIKAKVVGKMVFDVIDRVPEIRDHPHCSDKFDLTQAIRFQDITFKYPTAPSSAKNVLEGVSFQINSGETTAIVGPSGSGKSTIVQMIERFYTPLSGEIYFDQTNITDIKLKALRESIGYVSQEPVLILGTIRDNILFGNKDATDDDINHVIKEANATFIYDMESKLDTYIGSGSILNLSGGQKQRIAIARALIKKPKILILDEATSALDPKSEKEVQDAIDNISKGANNKLTIIMIAHRLQTIMTATNLIFIENKNTILTAKKGTPEYDGIMNKLQEQSHKEMEGEDFNDGQEKEQKDTQQIAKESIEVQDHAAGPTQAFSHFHELEKEDTFTSEKGNTKAQTNPQTVQVAKKVSVSMAKIMKHYSPKWMAAIGMLTSFVNGWAFPIYGLLYANILFVMMTPTFVPGWHSDRDYYCGLLLLTAVLMGLLTFIQKYVFCYIGENLTYTFRVKLFQSIVYKSISWFDAKDKAPGILSNILSEDINSLNGLTTENIALLTEATLTIVIGIILSFIYTWKMGLVSLIASPLVVFGGVMMLKLQWRNKAGNKSSIEAEADDPYQKSNALISDIIMNYRTVISFGEKNVDFLMNQFDQLLLLPNRQGIKRAHYSGFFFGYSQAIRFFFISFAFYIAAIFICRQGEDPKNTYIGVYILFISSIGSGVSISSAPSVAKARESGRKIFSIIEEKSKIDSREETGIKTIERGEIEFKNASFKYPSRNQKVLNNLNLMIPATNKIALVGHSGCGKSTLANLLLRMYDLAEGQILIDGKPITDYNIASLRHHIGIVMQEPILFNMSIKENILYGNDKADDAKVRHVADMANALQFIESNIEDLELEEVQKQLEIAFLAKLSKLTQTYQNMGQIEKYYHKDRFTFEEVKLIDEIFNKSDDILLQNINDHVERFIDIVNNNSKKKGCRWDDLVIKFDKMIEIEKITQFINSKTLKDKLKQEIIAFVTSHSNNVDMKLIKDIVNEMSMCEKDDDIQDVCKSAYDAAQERIRNSQFERIKQLGYQNILNKDGKIKLHDGFNKQCGLKGSKLSGGQKQRIAIARALIKDPKILILDEATSALDEKSQEIVQQALDRAMEGRTSIVIAHRLSTIRNCEWLFVIHNGRVVEQGTYEDLSSDTNSYFYKLKSGMEM